MLLNRQQRTKLDLDSGILDNLAVQVSNLSESYEFVRHVGPNIHSRCEYVAHFDQKRSRPTQSVARLR